MIPISAKSEIQLQTYVQIVKKFVLENPQIDLNDLAYTYQSGRKQFNYRTVLVVEQELEFNSKGKIKANELIDIRKEELSECRWIDSAVLELGKQWCNGLEVDWLKCNPDIKCKRIHVPTYPFAKKEYRLAEKAGKKQNEIESVKVKEEEVLSKSQRPMESIILEALGEIFDEKITNLDATFIELGGDSLTAIEFVEHLKSDSNIRFSVDMIWSHSIRELIHKADAVAVETEVLQQENDRISLSHNIQVNYALTPAQQQMYFLTESGENKSLYNLPSAVYLYGKLDKNCFQKALQYVIDRHEQLRAVFDIVGLEVRQRIVNHMECICTIKDIQAEFETEGSKIILNYLNKEENYVFDLHQGSLFRFQLLCLEEEQYCFLMNFHHIIFDAYSMNIFLNDLDTAYRQIISGKNIELPKLSEEQYTDYVVWIKENEKNENYIKAQEYWKEQFPEGIPKLNLPVEHFTDKKHVGRSQFIVFEEKIFSNLKKFNKIHNLTMYQTLFGAFVLLLRHYTGQNDIVVGTSSSGRMSEQTLNMIGMFVNTLPLRFQVEDSEKVETFILRVKEIIKNGIVNQIYPLPKIMEDVRRASDNSDISQQAINAFFSLEHPIEEKVQQLCGIQSESIPYLSTRALFDLALNAAEGSTELEIEITYDTALFEDESMKRWLENYKHLVVSLISNPSACVKDLEVLSEREQQFLLQDYNNTKMPLEENILVYDLIQRQMKEHPDNYAIDYNGIKVTYHELKKMVDTLSAQIQKITTVAKRPVVIFLDRSVQMIGSILTVLHLGGHYIPIDTEYPNERIRNILNVIENPLVITQKKYIYKFTSCEIIVLEMKEALDMSVTTDMQIEKKHREEDSIMPITADDLAYIIFTSGSSGNPKGVMIKHRGMVNYVCWAVRNYDAETSGDFPLYSSIAFDLTITSIFIPLVAGKTIFIQPEYLNGVELISHIVNEVNISSIKITPAHLEIILQLAKLNGKVIYGLKHVIVGGEPLSPVLVNEWFQFYPDSIIYNEYGPTETVVGCIVQKITKENIPIRNQFVPIGIPIDNTRIYLLDKKKNIVPMGAVGEIYVGGSGVAAGYFALEEKTRSSFVKVPFEHDVIYKTGDLARFRYDGILEHLGRCDDQIKIRGFRIELGEIEQRMLSYMYISNAVVFQHKNTVGQTILLAFFVSQKKIEISDLSQYLSKHLPSYMIPNFIMQVEELPLTINGKVDRKRLLDIYNIQNKKEELGSLQAEGNWDIYQIVLKLWSELLEKSNISPSDNFFTLGGNSLMVLPLVAKLREYIPSIQINDVFNYPVLESFVSHLKAQSDEGKEKKTEVWESNSLDIEEECVISHSYDGNIRNRNILLTGATGFLGSHLLEQLTKKKEIQVFCLVRTKNNKEPVERLRCVLEYYFSESTTGKIMNQIQIIDGDLEKEQFGLPEEKYRQLIENIDSILHCAADVRHYGVRNSNYQTNVEGTKRLLKLAESRKGITLHYISTTSIGNELSYSAEQSCIYEERFQKGESIENNYLQSKYISECMLYDAIDEGVPICIYRVGNLVGSSKTGIFQSNIETNAFYNFLKGMIYLKAAPDDRSPIDLTPIDYCSEAVTALVLGQRTYGYIYHICNPNPICFNDFIKIIQSFAYPIVVLKKKIFEKFLTDSMKNEKNIAWISCILMAYEPTDEESVDMQVDCRKAASELKKYGITCSKIDNKFVFTLLEYLVEIKYIPSTPMWKWNIENYKKNEGKEDSPINSSGE